MAEEENKKTPKTPHLPAAPGSSELQH